MLCRKEKNGAARRWVPPRSIIVLHVRSAVGLLLSLVPVMVAIWWCNGNEMMRGY